MSDVPEKPLIGTRAVMPILAGSKLGRLIAKLHGQQAAYHLWHGTEPRRELVGRGTFSVEIAEGGLRCRIFGEMFKPGPFEFTFHVFWLTRRGMLRTAFDLADNRPPEHRKAGEPFIHFKTLRDDSVRKDAEKFIERPH